MDRTITLLRHGYRFRDRIPGRRGNDPVPVRLIGRRALLVGGEAGVRLFYDTSRLRRRGATPKPLRDTLFGNGAVHNLDDEAHRVRKALFVTVVDPVSVERLGVDVAQEWQAALRRWPEAGSGTVHGTAVQVFGVAVQRWAGLSGSPEQMADRSRDLATVVDGFGSAGRRYLRARRARRQAERWAGEAIDAVRTGSSTPPAGSALALVAAHRDLGGSFLDRRTAPVELLNVLRPSVAVAEFAAFAAAQLIAHPHWRERIRVEAVAAADCPGPLATAFAQEVRRHSPFVPLLAAKARTSFTWNDHRIRKGQRVLLDVWGTDRDDGSWPDPSRFDPQRFLTRPDLADSDVFVPQGGGPVATGHRCPGEGVTMTLLTRTVVALAVAEWSVPQQDLTHPAERMPTRPRSGVVLTGVRPR